MLNFPLIKFIINTEVSKVKHKKGCFNKECEANEDEIKYPSNYKFCPMCGQKISYVCANRTCYKPLANVRKRYCDDCRAEQTEKKEKTKDQVVKVAKDLPDGVDAAMKLGPAVLAAPVVIKKAGEVVKQIIKK